MQSEEGQGSFAPYADVAEVFIGGNCNLACVFCPVRAHWGKRRKLEDIKEDMKKNEGKREALIFGGEIFEHEKWWEILSLAEEHFDILGVRTNATHLFDRERVKILRDFVDYVEVFTPAHFEYAHTRITSTKKIFFVFEEGLFNIRREGIPAILLTPLNGFIVREPYEYVYWVKEALGESVFGARVAYWPLHEDFLSIIKKKGFEITENLIPRLADAELLINKILAEFGTQRKIIENIPLCFVRDFEKVTALYTVSTKRVPECSKCSKKEVCKGVPEKHLDFYKKDGYAPIL